MENYRCIKSFDAKSGKHFHYNNVIDLYDYSELTRDEQCNFEEVYRDDESDLENESNLFGGMGDIFGTGIPGGIDMDFTTPL